MTKDRMYINHCKSIIFLQKLNHRYALIVLSNLIKLVQVIAISKSVAKRRKKVHRK